LARSLQCPISDWRPVKNLMRGHRSAERRRHEAPFMRKLINTFVAAVVLSGLGLGLPGCTDETGTKTEAKISTPGGTTTERREVNVDKSGRAPPSAPSEKPSNP